MAAMSRLLALVALCAAATAPQPVSAVAVAAASATAVAAREARTRLHEPDEAAEEAAAEGEEAAEAEEAAAPEDIEAEAEAEEAAAEKEAPEEKPADAKAAAAPAEPAAEKKPEEAPAADKAAEGKPAEEAAKPDQDEKHAGVAEYAAKDAKAAAEAARRAAWMANRVAAHSASVQRRAKAALKEAHEALADARANAEGLTESQRKRLEAAEEHLEEASRDTMHLSDTEGLYYGRAYHHESSELQSLRRKLLRLRRQLREEQAAGGADVEHLRGQIADLEDEIHELEGSTYHSSRKVVRTGHASPFEFDIPSMKAYSVPYGEIEPFGREDTAQELTESSIHESDSMVDQIERAQIAEEKRAIFRALTRLRGAAIASFDGIARAHTNNIDEFSRTYRYRERHPVRHLAEEESDYSKWAFPANADLLQRKKK